MTTGVIYARVSSMGDRQSTERQVKDLSEYAKYKGIEVFKVFEEHISGAKKNDERPVLCEAMYGHEIEMYTVEQGEKRDKRQ